MEKPGSNPNEGNSSGEGRWCGTTYEDEVAFNWESLLFQFDAHPTELTWHVLETYAFGKTPQLANER